MKIYRMYTVKVLKKEVYIVDTQSWALEPGQWIFDPSSQKVLRVYETRPESTLHNVHLIVASSKKMEGVPLLSKSVKKQILEDALMYWGLRVEFKIEEEQESIENHKKAVYTCKECGSKSIFQHAYTNINSYEFDSWVDTHDPMVWCGKCEAMVKYELKKTI